MTFRDTSSLAFGRRAREARALAEVARVRDGRPRATAAQVAREMSALIHEHVGARDVGKWMSGEAVPGSLARLWAFAEALGVDAGWLAFGKATAEHVEPRVVEREAARVIVPERAIAEKRKRA